MVPSQNTQTNATPRPAAPGATPARAAAAASAADGTHTAGTTVIDDAVVAKVAGIAIRDVPGVYALGGGMARMVGAVREAVGNTDLTQGVSVEVGERQVAADISLVAEYPVPLQALADQVRAAVATAITDLVGMEVAEVNVTISDVHVPSEEDEHGAAPRTAGGDRARESQDGEARVR
ncbi:Asp23/Gls24 family envelope stress response protein [Leucobacter sp. M11]|uniref:Asp23/Gls24 family envelope stress response protein n=1 Tax=Leucobacter sp. M11 TaxID=2993565 RepID=UPI002D7F91F3|nr:Asp23/Gls24 family envelope stress response protein [Leucobacter sp. M11]MEB4614691.1 Asp23/Gls24 family envelope stress response protein [Leucobacter sp. M11]